MTSTLSPIDIAVVVVYLAAIVGMSYVFARRQQTGEDYFLAGRRMGGLTLATSILANQASAVSLVGAPAFVALRENGGLRWLQYELAVPLAMLVLILRCARFRGRRSTPSPRHGSAARHGRRSPGAFSSRAAFRSV
jgi:Na+/proline symporter